MALHPAFPASPYAIPSPASRWFPANESLRSTAYEKLLPLLVTKVREEVAESREAGYPDASGTSRALLDWWFHTPHLIDDASGASIKFRYYFAQREAVETVIWLYDVRGARDKHVPARRPLHRRSENGRHLRQRHDDPGAGQRRVTRC